MKLIGEFKFDKLIDGEFEHSFEAGKDGPFLLEISARCKNWLQNRGRLFDDDDLTVSLDGRDLSGVEGRRAFERPKAGWNGNQLKNLSQINVFILKLKAGEHKLTFKPDQHPRLESLRIYEIPNPSKVEFVPQPPYDQAEDGDRRPWYIFALVGLALESLSVIAKASAGRQHGLFQSDDDDIQIKINGERQQNGTPKSHPHWFWCGRILKGESRTFKKELNLLSRTHYVELSADRTPTLERVTFKFTGVLPIGSIELYKDVTNAGWVHLREKPSDANDVEILAELRDGEEVEIIEERVEGSYVPDESNIWHKVNYKDQTGYILSSFVEIEGQEREVVIRKIRQKAAKLGADINNVLALAGCESQYKPYAVSEDGAKGIFQLTQDAINQLKNLDFEITDPFDVNQNIEGGIRYFRWLFETFYENIPQSLEKTVAAYNWGQGHIPPSDSLDLDNLPRDTAWLVTCVLENKKRKNWKWVFLPLLILAFALHSFLNRSVGTITEPEVLSQRTPTDSLVEVKETEVKKCPSLIPEDNGRVVLLDSGCGVVKKFDVESLKVADVFDLEEEEMLEKWFMLHLGHTVIQDLQDNFYFLVSNTYFCGMQNCTYALYRYDSRENILDVIDTDIFGAAVSLHLSPDGGRVAIVRKAHASVCDTRSYLEFINLADGKKLSVDKFQDPELEVTHIDDLKWVSKRRLKLLTTHSAGCDPTVNMVRHRRFFYDLETGKIESELREEKYIRG